MLLPVPLLGLPAAAAAQESAQYNAEELLIKLRGSSETGLNQKVLSLRPFLIPASAPGMGVEHWRIATFPESTDLEQAKEQRLANPEVERVEYKYRVKADLNEPHLRLRKPSAPIFQPCGSVGRR